MISVTGIGFVLLSPFITWIELEFPKAAVQVCSRIEEEDRLHEEGDPPDAHQHIDPMPVDYNLSVMDRMAKHVIRHNFH